MLGSGTELDPYQVVTASDLNNVRNNLSAHYIQMGNIDLSIYASWEPIGHVGEIEKNQFLGTYDGNNYTISNVNINKPTSRHVGLFAYLGKTALLKNIKIIESSVVGGLYTGGLVGYVYTRQSKKYGVDNCHFHGIVTASESGGGLIGYINNSSNAVVINCSASGEVRGGASILGGFVGEIGSLGVVKKCFSLCNVDNKGLVSGSRRFGGFVGWTNGSCVVENCFSRGNVIAYSTHNNAIGTNGFGGFVGWNNLGKIRYCYSTGKVIGYSTQPLGGFCGLGTTGVEFEDINNYWDIETSEMATSQMAESKTTAEMKTQSTFVDWDFSNVWKISPSTNNGYPCFSLGAIWPVAYPSIDVATTGRSPYITNPSSVKWTKFYGNKVYPFREGILITSDLNIITAVHNWDEDLTYIICLDKDGQEVWKSNGIGWDQYWGNLIANNNNKVYLTTDPHLVCVDATTGITDWSYDITNDDEWSCLYIGPVIHPDTGDIIFNSSPCLYCIKPDGTLKWKIHNDYGFDEHGIAISPYNGLIYTASFGGIPGDISDHDYIYAFDIDGNNVYSFDVDAYFGNLVSFFCSKHAPTITSNGTVLVGSDDDIVAAFNPDLTLKWFNDIPTWGISMISNGALSPDESVWYCPDWYGRLYAVDVETGAILWVADINEVVAGRGYNEAGLVVDAEGKILYAANPWWGSGNNSFLVTVNPDGSIFSTVDLGAELYISSTPSIAPDGTVYLNDYNTSYLYAINSSVLTMTYVNCVSAGMIQSANTRKIIRPIFKNLTT